MKYEIPDVIKVEPMNFETVSILWNPLVIKEDDLTKITLPTNEIN